MATEMLRNPHIFYGLSHMKAQFMVSARFSFDNSFLLSFEKNPVFGPSIREVVHILTVTTSIALNMLTII